MIITSNENGNMVLGQLQVKKADELREFRDGLLQNRADLNNYRIFSEKDKGGFCSVLRTGYARRDNALIHQFITERYGNDECSYTREMIEHNYLNSVLLFFSLLGELDATYYDELAKQFIANGIIKCAPIDTMWDSCSKGIVKSVFTEIDQTESKNLRMLKMLDLKAFRFALSQGIISYDQQEEISFSENIGNSKFKSFNMQDLERISINNALLLGNDDIFKKYIRRKNG